MAARQIGATTKLPLEFILTLHSAGADLKKECNSEEDAFYRVLFKANSEPHKRYIEFCSRYDHDKNKAFDPVVFAAIPDSDAGIIPTDAHMLGVWNYF